MLARKLWHASITLDRVMEAAEREMFSLDNPGFCLLCGEEADGCEPDAREYTCENCDGPFVYGAQELLLHFDPRSPSDETL